MKRLLFVFLLCALVPFLMGVSPFVRTDGEPQVQGPLRVYEPIYNFVDGFDQIVKTKTKDDLTLYVRTTGNDANDCLSSGNACLTIQEVVDRMPKNIRHIVTLDIGEGSFSDFKLKDFNIGKTTTGYAAFNINGVLGNPTLGGGTVSGTADGGSTTQCVDSGQVWVVNELRGRLVLVGGEYRVVRNNDGTTMNLVGPLGATCNGKAYELFEQKTIIDSGSDTGRITVKSMTFSSHASLTVTDIATDGGVIGLFVSNGRGTARTVRCKFSNGTYGVWHQNLSGDISSDDIYIENANIYGFGVARCPGMTSAGHLKRLFVYGGCTTAGISVSGVNQLFFETAVVDSTSGVGMGMYDCTQVWIDNFQADSNDIGFQSKRSYYVTFAGGTVENSTQAGLRISTCSVAYFTGTMTVSNNGAHGVEVIDGTFVDLNGALVGTGNTGYGMMVGRGSYVFLNNGNTTVTGTAGNVSVNDGTTTTTWAFFDENGDFVVNTTNGATIERNN
jgi:hypothetical protein